MTPKMAEALELLAAAETRDPPGLAESNATSAELGTIYHATARRLLEADDHDGFGEWIYQAGRDRYLRPLYRIGDNGRAILASLKETTS